MIPKLTHLTICTPYTLSLSYTDGTQGSVDMSDFISVGPYRVLLDPNQFARASIKKYRDVIAWTKNLDVDAFSLYLKIRNIDFMTYMSNHVSTN